MTAPLTPGAYLARRRTAAGLTIADVAARVATEPKLAEHVRVEWIESIEADLMPATFRTLVALRHAYPFDFPVLAALVRLQMGDALAPPRLCRTCACSHEDPCINKGGPCWWVEDDLCCGCWLQSADTPSLAASA